MKINMSKKTHEEALSRALKPYMARAIAPILGKLGISPQQEQREYEMNFNLRFAFTVAARKKQFSDLEILEASNTGKYPRGMTAQDLLRVPNTCLVYKRETCLHLAARKGKMPRGTRLNDLLEMRSGTSRRAIFALFDSKEPHYTSDTTARDLLKIKQNELGTLLHRAAQCGIYPNGTTIMDLEAVRNKSGETPLHIAARFGGLLPCTQADSSRVKDTHGKSAWDYAAETLNTPAGDKQYWDFYAKRATKNILSIPRLASKLRPQTNEFHQLLLVEVLASPKLTPEIREQLAKYPRVCAAML